MDKTREAILKELYELGGKIAYGGFRHPTDTPFDVYKERYITTSNAALKTYTEKEFNALIIEGKCAYERGFNEYRGSKIVDVLNDIRRNHLGVDI